MLKAARQATKGRVIAVHQPHRYTRLRDLFSSSAPASTTPTWSAIADVYAAGEAPIDGHQPRHLVGGLIAPRPPPRAAARRARRRWRDFARASAGRATSWSASAPGSISAWANALPARLNAGNHHKEPVEA